MKKTVSKKEFNDYKKQDKKEDKALVDKAMKSDKMSDARQDKKAVAKRVKTM